MKIRKKGKVIDPKKASSLKKFKELGDSNPNKKKIKVLSGAYPLWGGLLGII